MLDPEPQAARRLARRFERVEGPAIGPVSDGMGANLESTSYRPAHEVTEIGIGIGLEPALGWSVGIGRVELRATRAEGAVEHQP